MLRSAIVAGTYTANATVPLSEVSNTNEIYKLTANTIKIRKAGISDVKANIVFTATGTNDTTAQLYADGSAVSNAFATITPASDGTYTLSIDYPLLVKYDEELSNVAISLQLNQGCKLVGGYFTVEHRA